MSEASYLILGERGLISVGGKDRKSFLQGLVSNDIEAVSPTRAIWAALLTPQGKYLHDFFIVEIDDVFYLDCEAARLKDLGQRLSGYKLRAEIDLGIAEDFRVAAVYGPKSLEILSLSPEPGLARTVSEGLVYCDPRTAELGARAVLRRDKTDDFLPGFQVEAGSRDSYDAIRIPLGVPDGSRDLIVEKSILMESNFDALNGVDWAKGCYVGQELTARTKYRGLVKKRLVPVSFDGIAPAPGTQILHGSRDAGEIRSSSGGIGLASLRIEPMEQALAGEGDLVAGEATLAPHPIEQDDAS
jgi:hypothetical protein